VGEHEPRPPPSTPSTRIISLMSAVPASPLPLDTTLLKPGLRLAVGISGGADSVALLRTLHEHNNTLGLVLQAAHLHHGLRGAEAEADLEFVRALAADLGIPFHQSHVDVQAEKRKSATQKAAESTEEAARRLRYAWFRQLMADGLCDAVTTAHTLDDQAETVCAKFLRGAWTEGLSGIHPVVDYPEGRVLRPLLAATRTQVEAYLHSIGQPWREDSSNRDPAFTRNRIRHELLPLLETWNPRLRQHLAQMAEMARDEEAWWQAEIARVAPQILMAGRPVRGGGRASGDGLAIDSQRLAVLPPAMQRRLLRHAASQLGVTLDFPATEALRSLALEGRAGQKRELTAGLRAERTPRELRLTVEAASSTEAIPEYTCAIPGEILAPEFGLRIRIESEAPATAILRNWRPGDRVQLRYSSGPKRIKEVLERLRVTGSARAIWPVLEVAGRILWMRGVELESDTGIRIVASETQ